MGVANGVPESYCKLAEGQQLNAASQSLDQQVTNTTVPPLNRDLAAMRETIKGLCDEIERLNLELAKLRQPVAETKPTFPARALHFAPVHKVGP